MSVNKSNIYTKGGDGGETSLIGGTRIPKNHPCLEAYGGMDELNSWLGLCMAQLEEIGLKRFETQTDWMKDIQEDIFVFGSILACEEGREGTLPKLEQTDVGKLEQYIDEMDECLLPLKNFILPGGSIPGACLHMARTHCRKVERDIVALEKGNLPPLYLAYINRLSDFLFVLARYVNTQLGSSELLWKPRMQ